MSRIIEIVPYNPEWPKLFAHEAKYITAALGSNLITIHHIGSTSVPGLAAKPVIDMIPVVNDILKVDTLALTALGYVACGEFGMPFRRFFTKGGDQRTHHLHIWEEGNPEIEKHLRFRRYLQQHPEEIAQYARLKSQLAEQFRQDSDGYTTAKDDFIQKIINKAGFTGLLMVQACTPRQWETYYRLGGTRESLSSSHAYWVFSKGITLIGQAHIACIDSQRATLKSFALEQPHQQHHSYFLKLLQRWCQHHDMILLPKED